MKAHELAKKLLEGPDYDVSVSVDVSTDGDDYDKRAFGDEVFEIMEEHSRSRVTILMDGYLN